MGVTSLTSFHEINITLCSMEKLIYATEIEAQAAIVQLQVKYPGRKLYYYHCTACQGYHLTKDPVNKQNRPFSLGGKPHGYWAEQDRVRIKKEQIVDRYKLGGRVLRCSDKIYRKLQKILRQPVLNG